MEIRDWSATFPYLCVAATLLTVATSLAAQNTQKFDPAELVRSAAANEIAAAKNASVKFMFRSRRKTQKNIQNRVYVQSNEGMASMIVGEGDQPLPIQRERGEMQQLMELAKNPDRLNRKQQREKQELEHTLRIVKALPDAFCYEYAGTETPENGLGKAGNQLVRLKFKPNPSYAPPSSVEQVLLGMEGTMLVDAEAHRIARVDATLFKDVNFGWGILGRVDKGGAFRVQQADEGFGNWVITEINVKLAGKILLLKSLNLMTDEVFQDFQRLPDNLPFARAVEMLQTEEGKIAQNTGIAQPLQISQTPH